MSGSQQQQQQSPNFYRTSFSPTDQHHPPYQGSGRQNHTGQYHPVANGHAAALPPTAPYNSSSRSYYDPVDRSGEVNSGSGWSVPGRERTSSVNSQARYNYGEHAASGGAPSPVEQHHFKGGYPLQSPNSNVERRSSSVHGGDPGGVDTNLMHSEYRAHAHEPTSPSTPARRGGAMSISALLTNAEDPSADSTSHTRVSPTLKRQTATDKQINRSPDATRTSVRQANARPMATSNYDRTWDADATDSEHEAGLPAAVNNNKKSAAFRDFKYHGSMNVDTADLERSDSDADSDEFMSERIDYMKRNRKRQLDIEEQEKTNRKRRRLLFQSSLQDHLADYGHLARVRAQKMFYEEAMEKVLLKEEEEEKERKKEQQRKRRREKAEVEKKIKAEMAQKAVQDAAAQGLMDRGSLREHSTKLRISERPVFEEGIIDYSMDAPDSDVSGVLPEEEGMKKIRKKPGPKAKPKPPLVAPRDIAAEPMDIVKQDSKEDFVPHASKTYNQLFDQIWKDIARKEIPKLHRHQQSNLTVKQSNLRKTAQLASKEAQRWKLRTTKNIKDTQARAKRSMREMLTFWKRNEREERDLRRRAEKEAIDRAKREEEQREAKRQARKLNFLISQTELYSHFIGRKIKTDEIEKSTGADGIEASNEITADGSRPQPVLGDELGKVGPTVSNFEDLDFDDEEALQKAAMNNAQHAIQAAQDRARAFNQQEGEDGKVDLSNVNLDEGEMNFQNPTSLGDLDIQQPKMLNCQLKEYQLKGLNWLCNLYEQGINGILADEMGLGKTVQSISVMAYLAEYHNIWGPFLVIAPASTLHNWQQEITRFVPTLKALPYWGTAKDRKVLRKFWDRKSLTYTQDSPFHVLITSYQLVVQDTQYFQRMKWQYMILDEAQAIKSSSSSRWKALLGFHCRNRLLLTGTPIQNSMQELWALLHFIMPSLFDSHDEFSEWFSKDIESHAQSNTQLNESQLRRLHMILKPFMLRRVKKHVQKELGDKVETDVFCNLTYRQRAIYKSLRDKISIMDLIEKAASGGEENTATLMNLVMQFRKVCNHPDLFERADVRPPLSFTGFGETGSFLRESGILDVPYTARNLITYHTPVLVYRNGGRLDLPGNDSNAGSRRYIMNNIFNIWRPDYIRQSIKKDSSGAFSWVPHSDTSSGEVSKSFHKDLLDRLTLFRKHRSTAPFSVVYDDEQPWTPSHTKFLVPDIQSKELVAHTTEQGVMQELLNVSQNLFRDSNFHSMEPMAFRPVSMPPVNLYCANQSTMNEQDNLLFNLKIRQFLWGAGPLEDTYLLENSIEPSQYPSPKAFPEPSTHRFSFSSIQVPSMGRFVSDSGKLAELDRLLTRLKTEGHRVLLYFQMTKMMDLCEEYLTYRHHRYLRLDGSSKLEDRRDMVAAWQTNPEIFVFILSTRAGGLGINLTAADTVIFYDSDWNPTIDSQAMDRAHRLGQTKQVSVYRLITRGTIEERIRMRAQQKEEVQRVVIQGGDPGAGKKNVDFKGSTREVATWLFDNEEAEKLEKTLEAKEREMEEQKAKGGKARGKKKKTATEAPNGNKAFNIEDMYHEGEGRFDDSGKPSEAGTPQAVPVPTKKRGPKPKGNKKKTTQERLNMIDGTRDVDMGGM